MDDADEPAPTAAPTLSTPDTRIFEEATPVHDTAARPAKTDEQLAITYEIERTVSEIRRGRWRRAALQFPDHMLPDAPRVFRALSTGLASQRHRRSTARSRAGADVGGQTTTTTTTTGESAYGAAGPQRGDVSDAAAADDADDDDADDDDAADVKLFILADTSYGACCVDEVAAEHASADVVVHYGRSCLSPTARLPVVYVYTRPPLDVRATVECVEETYASSDDRSAKIILTADIPYMSYVAEIHRSLVSKGWTGVYATDLVHDTSSPIPNRTTPPDTQSDPDLLRTYSLFHISTPPESLLLTLSSSVCQIHICPIDSTTGHPSRSVQSNTASALRRRYALLTRLTTIPVWGILINTLSVQHYMSILQRIKQLIARAGRKSYTFVVGKVNAAKVANFGEVEGWVVIGCWESCLFDSKDFWRPVITPFELELALQSDDERVWTGAWRGDFERLLERGVDAPASSEADDRRVESASVHQETGVERADESSEEESAPPDFDLRTGKYVSSSRPMARSIKTANGGRSGDGSPLSTTATTTTTTTLTRRPKQDLATIGGELSPAAEFLRNKRTWRGLGSDFTVEYDEGDGSARPREAAVVEEGRRGIARGYVVGDDLQNGRH